MVFMLVARKPAHTSIGRILRNTSKITQDLTKNKTVVLFTFACCSTIWGRPFKILEASALYVRNIDMICYQSSLTSKGAVIDPVPDKASKLMEVQFEGETGFGIAVTQSFYATRLHDRWQQKILAMLGLLLDCFSML